MVFQSIDFFMSVLKLLIITRLIHNAVNKYADNVDDAFDNIKTTLYPAPAVHANETGVHKSRKILWLHNIGKF